MDPLQVDSHMVQKHHASEQGIRMHWDETDKENYHFR